MKIKEPLNKFSSLCTTSYLNDQNSSSQKCQLLKVSPFETYFFDLYDVQDLKCASTCVLTMFATMLPHISNSVLVTVNLLQIKSSQINML